MTARTVATTSLKCFVSQQDVANMALYLAVLPAAADVRLALFFALCQFPLFLSPFLLRPVYALARRLA